MSQKVFRASRLVPVSRRLVRLREALGYTQVTMANLLDISLQTWNNYELESRRIELENALKIVARFGVPLDYIYVGDTTHLPALLKRRLAPGGALPRVTKA